jgi:hypothetical protein
LGLLQPTAVDGKCFLREAQVFNFGKGFCLGQ